MAEKKAAKKATKTANRQAVQYRNAQLAVSAAQKS
jgi:hypothetical protein